MKQVMNYHKDNGLLNMIRRTDPMITMGSYIGGYIFDNFYLPYIYYPLYNINTFNNSLREEIEYNKLFIPNYWSFPY